MDCRGADSSAALLGGSESAGAATLKASYQLQGDRVSEVSGAPELFDLGTGNSFAFETVEGIGRQVLVFPKGNGLSLATTGLVDPRSHSVAMLFRLVDLSGFRRIFDFSGSTSDNGLYNLNGKVVLYGSSGVLYGSSGVSQGAVFDHSYAQLVLTNAAASGGSQETTVYVNGTAVAAAMTANGFNLSSGVLQFFKDNTSGPAGGEESAGAVACIQVYDGTLTPDEVGQLADDPVLCPVPGPAEVLKTGRPKAERLGRSIVVDTGLTVSCPVGTASCAASGRVDVVSTRRRAAAASAKNLGVDTFSVPAGTSKSVVVRLSGNGARALRKARTLRIRASAEITPAGGSTATAQQTGRIEVPWPRTFEVGTYTGTTSQGLPIFIGVGRMSIQTISWRWRVRCADGQMHTSTIFLRGERIRRGRFSFGGVLNTGGRARVSGRIQGVHASGTLSRMGTSAFGTRCTAKRIRWHARASGIEVEAPASRAENSR